MAEVKANVYQGYNRNRLNKQIENDKKGASKSEIREVMREEIERADILKELNRMYEAGEISEAEYTVMIKELETIGKDDDKNAKKNDKVANRTSTYGQKLDCVA